MSTSIMYHAFGVRGYRYVRTDYQKGGIHFTIEQERKYLRCAACGDREVVLRGGRWREFRGVPVGRRAVWIHFRVPRVKCNRCGVVRQVEVTFTEGQGSFTKRFGRYALELSRLTTVQDAARHLGVSWDVIKDLQKRDLKRRFGRPKLSHLRLLAIDEIALGKGVGKGHRYLTIVLDLEEGAVVFVGEGKGSEALEPFWRRLKRSGARIEAVAVDLSPAYTLAVRTHLPEAKIVYDPFHLVKLLNDKLSDLRRELQRKAEQETKAELKGTRWLLLKRAKKLDEKREEPERLESALRLNEPLATGYYLKEDFAELWKQPDKATAEAFLVDWIASAGASGIRQLRTFAKTLESHQEGILAFYDFRISTGPLEGVNNKIKTMQRRSYGFRDSEFLRLKIYALHETRYALVG